MERRNCAGECKTPDTSTVIDPFDEIKKIDNSLLSFVMKRELGTNILSESLFQPNS